MSNLLCDDLPTYSKTGGGTKQMITMFLKPNEGKDFYRFRLLNFRNPNSDRDYAFIKRWVHTHWGKTDKGVNIVDDTVVCLTTNYVNFEGGSTMAARREACPMCRHDNENFSIWKGSGWKDKIAMKKHFQMQKQFQGVVPVYVVQDPNNDKNNGKLKCFIFNDPEDFENFDKLVHQHYNEYKKGRVDHTVFNGKNAVDFYLRMEKVPEIRNEGKPNETTVEVRKITKMAFGKTPHDIPGIEEMLKDFEFDEQYYTENTVEEIEAFYRKHYAVALENIPQEDIDILDEEVDVKAKQRHPATGAEILKAETNDPDPLAADVDIDSDDLLDDNPKASNSIPDESDGIGSQADLPEDGSPEIDSDEVDSLINELDRT